MAELRRHHICAFSVGGSQAQGQHCLAGGRASGVACATCFTQMSSWLCALCAAGDPSIGACGSGTIRFKVTAVSQCGPRDRLQSCEPGGVCHTDPPVPFWLWLASAREELQNYMINMLNDTRRCQGTCVQSHMCYEASSSDRQSLPGSGPLRSEALLLPHSISAMPKGLLCQYDLITQPWASCTPRAGACPTL